MGLASADAVHLGVAWCFPPSRKGEIVLGGWWLALHSRGLHLLLHQNLGVDS